MKKMLVVAGLLLAVAAAVSVQAAERKFDINVGGGVSIPIGNFGDAAGIGFHGDGNLMWHLKPQIDVGPAVSVHFFGNDLTAPGVSGSWTELMFGGTIQYKFQKPMGSAGGGSKIMPYLDGGIGFANTNGPDYTFGGFTYGASSTDLYISLGAGAHMNKWFGKIRWVDVMTSGSSASFFPLTIGYTF